MGTKTVIVDGIGIEFTDQGAQAIEKLQKKLTDADATLAAANTAHAGELARAHAERDAAVAKVMTDAQIATLVTERGALIAQAGKFTDADLTGLTADAIRKTVVVAKFGDAAVAGRDQAYIDARYDILIEDAAATADPMRTHVQRHGTPTTVVDSQGEYETRLTNAWRTPNAQGGNQ